MNHQVTHNQHYVWRKYLEPWGDKKEKKVFVWWNNQKVIRYTDVFDILKEKDFYEYKPLNKLELYCLKEMFVKSQIQAVKDANSNIEKLISIVSSMDKSFIENEQVKNLLIQTGEEVQSVIEKNGIRFLSSLQNGELSIFNYEENGEMIDFLIFLLFQYFRTKGKREKTVNAVSGNNELLKEKYREAMGDDQEYDVDWNKIYNFGYVFLVNQICYVMTYKTAHIKLLKSQNVKFIVSDQPVYNAAENKSEDFDLFYPISPDIAILVSCQYAQNEVCQLTDDEVLKINQNTVNNAYKFIIGINKTYVNLDWKK